jgi:citrate lyase subunit beta/citryl-CoA lyase
MVIHPDQVATANAVYSPTPDEAQWSKKVVAAFRAAEAAGSASIQLEGQFIDYPIVYKAERILALAERLGLG